MKVQVDVKNVQNIAIAVKFGETGDITHTLKIECVLATGDTDRILQMFKERAKYGAPVILSIQSPQARMALNVVEVEVGKAEIVKPPEEPTKELTAIDDVELSIEANIEKGTDDYRCRIGELVGIDGCPRDAILNVLLGQNVVPGFRLGEVGPMVEQLADHMKTLFPDSGPLRRLLWALTNNSFEIPTDLDKPKKNKEPVSV